MLALSLCGGALLLCYFAGRRSLEGGLVAVLTVGYFYGIVRANVPGTYSYFIFDAGVLGLYAAQLLKPLSPADRLRIQSLMPWLGVLIGWPALLLLLPIQDPMVQLVGLRAHVFLLPFLFFGARLHPEQIRRLALGLAVLNLVAFGFAVAEFTLGVERFYPRNTATELIYRSRDVQTGGLAAAFRIPAIFANAQLYGATMVMTLPLLMGLWLRRHFAGLGERVLLTAAVFASALGVFFSASRVNFLILTVLVLATTLSGRLKLGGRVAAVVMVGVVAWIVSQQERLFQRLTILTWDSFVERIAWSINDSLIAFMFGLPFGNGLGGGGTNMPYFLAHLVRDGRAIENHYGTLLLELGTPGLFLWLCFIAWILTRRTTPRDNPWHFARRLYRITVAAYFGQALIGVGLMSALPFSALFLLAIGWTVVPLPEDRRVAAAESEMQRAFTQRLPTGHHRPVRPAAAQR
jgi:hypothetical protein